MVYKVDGNPQLDTCDWRMYSNILKPGLRLLLVLVTENTLLGKFLNIWRQILYPGDLDDDAYWNFCTIKPGTFNFPRGLQLPACLNNYQCIFT